MHYIIFTVQNKTIKLAAINDKYSIVNFNIIILVCRSDPDKIERNMQRLENYLCVILNSIRSDRKYIPDSKILQPIFSALACKVQAIIQVQHCLLTKINP